MKNLTLLVVFLALFLQGCTFHGVDASIPYRYPDGVVSGDLPPLPGEEGTDEPEVVPPDPACELVKGNIDRTGRKLYHLPGMRNYNQVKIDESKGEQFFCTEQEALDAGWVKAGN